MKTVRTSNRRSEGRPYSVLVTGGAGFLGSHLCDYLINQGYKVTCVDSLLTSTGDNIRHLHSHPWFRFMYHDVTEPFEVNGHVDLVFHLASTASPKDYYRYPIDTLLAGSIGTYNVLGVARTEGAVFVLASSSEVYGDPEEHPQTEGYWGHVNPVGHRSVYDEAKRYAEAITMAYAREHGMDVRIARIFNTYGDRMRLDDGRVLPNFFAQALQNEPITVYGDGSQTRSLCHVDDLTAGLYRLATLPRSAYTPLENHYRGEVMVFNLGNPEEVAVLEIAREVIHLTESRSPIVFEPLPEDDPRIRQPDIRKAREILGWEPKVGRHDGLRLTLPYFRAALEQRFQPFKNA
jgi:dTDP-glucose 4,6-dehydratase